MTSRTRRLARTGTISLALAALAAPALADPDCNGVYGRETNRINEEHARDMARCAGQGAECFKRINAKKAEALKAAGQRQRDCLRKNRLYLPID